MKGRGSKLILLTALLASIVMGSCISRKVTAGEYIQWTKENRQLLQQCREGSEVKVCVTLQPSDYIMVSNGDTGSEKEKDKYDNLIQFKVEIKPVDSSVENLLKYNLHRTDEYFDRLKYYAFDAKYDFFLLNDEGDTIKPSGYHFVRTFGLSPELESNVVFELKKDFRKGFKLSFAERVYNHKVYLFDYQEIALRKIPKVKINEKI